MTPKRWEIVGGLAMGGLFIFAVGGIMGFPTTWQGLLIGIAVAVVGNAVGENLVREWFKAGKEGP